MSKKRSDAPKKTKSSPTTEVYEHSDATVALRPDAGTQAQFKKQKPNQRYRYDSSLAPALEWDGQNAAREQGEALIAEILALSDKIKAAKSDQERDAATTGLQEAARRLKALGQPFLNCLKAGTCRILLGNGRKEPCMFPLSPLSTKAWENIKKALKGDYAESVWDHLASTISAPFEAGEHRQIAVKVIDDRGNELVVVKSLQEAEKGR